MQSKWYKLDNAAKIVPPTTKGADTRVFRISCELTEDVDGALLQSALDMAARDFPHFSSILRRGLFWYYLEESSLQAAVEPDNLPACCAIYRAGRRNLLYRVSFYRRRINLEMFHVLADGTGAMAFLKTIVRNYLLLAHPEIQAAEQEDLTSTQEKTEDAFVKYYEKESEKPEEAKWTPKRAYHLHGERDEHLQVHLLEGTVSTKQFIAAAKAHNTTVAVFSTALFMEAILQEMRVQERRLPIILSVPVNLRNFFPSETARNFFGVINVTLFPSEYDGTTESIVHVVQDSFRRQLTQEQVSLTMQGYAKLEHNPIVKLIPLSLKNLVISLVNSHVQRGITGTVSNVGRVTMPAPFDAYIDRFSCFMAAPDVQVSVSSFGGRLCFGIASPFESHPVMMRFFRSIAALGVEVEIASNDCWAEENRDAGQKTGKGRLRDPAADAILA